jgi:HEAT repeat protein
MDELLRQEELPQEDFERVHQFLLGIYRDETKSRDERRFAIEALSFLSDEEIMGIIAEAYAHPDPKMKLSAIFAMGRNSNERWGDILLKEIYSPERVLQLEAIRAVGEARWDAAGPDLARLTYAEDRDVQLEAVWALGQTSWEHAFDWLEELSLMSSDPEMREVAEIAMEEWLDSRQLFGDGEFDIDDLDQ